MALVGHEPGLSALTSWLLFGDGTSAPFAFRKGAAACLELEQWAPGSAALQWFAPPKLLRRRAGSVLSRGSAT